VALTDRGDNSDMVILRAPREKGSLPIMRVVIGGVASRYALSVDRLDDVQLAVETLFREEPPDGGDLSLSVRVTDDMFKVTIAGLRSRFVRETLSATKGVGEAKDGRADILRMIMDALVDGYRSKEGAADGSFSVEMEKRIS
jgi:hypothetical protein